MSHHILIDQNEIELNDTTPDIIEMFGLHENIQMIGNSSNITSNEHYSNNIFSNINAPDYDETVVISDDDSDSSNYDDSTSDNDIDSLSDNDHPESHISMKLTHTSFQDQTKQHKSEYKTKKASLDSIIIDTAYIPIIRNAVSRAHKLMIYTYQFISTWVLRKYHNNKVIPQITPEMVRMIFRVLTGGNRGPKPKGTNLSYYEEFEVFSFVAFANLNSGQQVDGTHLSHITQYLATEVVTGIENNVKQRFFNHLYRCVNSCFRKEHYAIIDKLPRKEQPSKRKQLRAELNAVKRDLRNNTKLCDEKYYAWLDKHRMNMLPPLPIGRESYEADMKADPQRYIKNMIYICLLIEEHEGKLFHFMPLRTSIVPSYMPIDTAILVDLFIHTNPAKYLDNIGKHKEVLWDRFFRMDNKAFRRNGYTFDHRISTDGRGVSLQFLVDSSVETVAIQKQNRNKCCQEAKTIYADMSQTAKEELKASKEAKRKDQKAKDYQAYKNAHKNEPQKKRSEYQYLDSLSQEQLEYLKNHLDKLVWIDPGKKELLYMTNLEGKTFRYTNAHHLHATKRLLYQKKQQRYKNEHGISALENLLSAFNSKTCNLERFEEYVYIKNQINDILLPQYEAKIFRQHRWYGYINRERAYAKLLDRLEKAYGKESIMLYGDWSIGQQMRNFISTPNSTLRGKVRKRFATLEFDEFRTSCLSSRTHERCENLEVLDKTGKSRELHSVLTYQMENKRKGCINRNRNAVENMRYITIYQLLYGERPIEFRRENKSDKSTQPGRSTCLSCQVGKLLADEKGSLLQPK